MIQAPRSIQSAAARRSCIPLKRLRQRGFRVRAAVGSHRFLETVERRQIITRGMSMSRCAGAMDSASTPSLFQYLEEARWLTETPRHRPGAAEGFGQRQSPHTWLSEAGGILPPWWWNWYAGQAGRTSSLGTGTSAWCTWIRARARGEGQASWSAPRETVRRQRRGRSISARIGVASRFRASARTLVELISAPLRTSVAQAAKPAPAAVVSPGPPAVGWHRQLAARRSREACCLRSRLISRSIEVVSGSGSRHHPAIQGDRRISTGAVHL